jgi:hypothetical protein
LMRKSSSSRRVMTAGLVTKATSSSRKAADQSIAWKCRLWRVAGGAHIARAHENQNLINHLNDLCANPHLPISLLSPFSGTENNVQTTSCGQRPGGL